MKRYSYTIYYTSQQMTEITDCDKPIDCGIINTGGVIQINLPNGRAFINMANVTSIKEVVREIEPFAIKKGCKYRCLSDMVNQDTGNISFLGDKIYLAPEDNTLVSEENGWRCDTFENASNFELVEEPISENV